MADGRFLPMGRSKSLSPATILIAENEALVRLELAHHLGQAGLLVLEARNAEEAIALLDTHSEIELVVANVRMPGSMDGIRLAHHVRGRWPPVKIIVVSGRLETELSELPSGGVFFSKPYEHETIRHTLQQMLTGARAA